MPKFTCGVWVQSDLGSLWNVKTLKKQPKLFVCLTLGKKGHGHTIGNEVKIGEILGEGDKCGDTAQQIALNLGSVNSQVSCRGGKFHNKVNSFWKKRKKKSMKLSAHCTATYRSNKMNEIRNVQKCWWAQLAQWVTDCLDWWWPAAVICISWEGWWPQPSFEEFPFLWSPCYGF